MLVKCGECGADVSDKAGACPKCGAPSSFFEQPDIATHEIEPVLSDESNQDQNTNSKSSSSNKNPISYLESPGYQELNDWPQELVKKSYINGMGGGALIGFIIATLLTFVGLKSDLFTLLLASFGAISVAVIKYICHNAMHEANNDAGLVVVGPNDKSYLTIIYIVIGAVSLYGLRPNNDLLAKTIDEQILKEISMEKFNKKDNFSQSLLKFGCKMDAASCAKAIRSTLDIQIKDFWIGKFANIKNKNKETPCIGGIKIWHCFW